MFEKTTTGKYVYLLDHNVELTENYVDLSEDYVDLSDIKLTNWQIMAIKGINML